LGNQVPPLTGALPRPFGKYTLTRELGRGAMGLVYEARDSALDRRVALKLMLPSDHPDPKEAAIEEQLFTREAQLCGRLEKHPNIVSVYEAGTIEARRYIAMEFIDGTPLSDWVQLKNPSLRARVRILRDVAHAVHHAHKAGILHRDLKPKNVLVDAQGRPFVTDFGMAKQVRTDGSGASSTSAAGTVVGTPSYMSPEQAQGLRKVDVRTDVYALGAILYEILAGAPPFPGEMTIIALMRIVQDPIPPPSAASPTWAKSPEDKSIEAACMRALAKDPDDRFPDALAFADQLTKWLGDKPPTAPVKKSEDEKSRRNLNRIWIPAAILPVGIIMLLILSQALRKEPPPESRWDQAAGLLTLVDPVRDTVAGSWKMERGSLVSAASARARIEIPWRAAPEYDLRVIFVRRDGADDAAVLLPWKGSPFVWKTPPLENGVLHTAVFRVRNDGVTTLLSGPKTESRSTTSARGPAEPKWALRDPAVIGLGADESVLEIRGVDLLEFSGKGSPRP
jgi:serine/threonine protein kinase